MYRVRDVQRGSVVGDHVRPAHTHWTRLRGLLGTRTLPEGCGLWIQPCRQVHMFGMRYAIDVVFLDAGHRVVGLASDLQPGRISPKVREATSVLELPAGTIARVGLVAGAQLEIADAAPA
jgi:uncharacterized membrane protein (UPF0127 family)